MVQTSVGSKPVSKRLLAVCASKACQHSIAKKCFDIWDSFKIDTVKSVQPGSNSFGINYIIRWGSKLLPLGFLKFALVLIL